MGYSIRRRPYASKSGLFLIELILTVFFFIASAAVIMQIFVRSHLTSENTICVNNAILHTQNIAEVFLASDGDFSSVKSLYAGLQADIPAGLSGSPDYMLLLFDKGWEHTADAERAKYCVFADHRRDGDFSYATVYVSKFSPSVIDNMAKNIPGGDYAHLFPESDTVYRQEIKKYCGGQMLPYGQ